MPIRKILKVKPHKILLWSIPFTFFPLLFELNGSYDLLKHDTYFVTSLWIITLVFVLVLGLTSALYWFVRDYKLIEVLSLTHSLITAGAIIGFSLLAVCQTLDRARELNFFHELNSIGIVLLSIILIVQYVFLINILIGLIRGKKGKNN